MIGNVRVIHVRPESDRSGKILPHSLVFPNTFLTLFNEGFQSVSFNLLFSVKAQKLFHFNFNRKTVGIPARFSRHHIALHCAVSRNHILDNTGENVSDMRFSVCSRRSVIESIGFSFLAVFHTFPENVVVLPEFLYFFFSLYKIKIRTDFLVHNDSFLPNNHRHIFICPRVRKACFLIVKTPFYMLSKHEKRRKAHKTPMVFYSFRLFVSSLGAFISVCRPHVSFSS